MGGYSFGHLHSVELTKDMFAYRGEQHFPWSVDRFLNFVSAKGLVKAPQMQGIAELEEALSRALDQLPAVRTAIHGDPQPGNLLVGFKQKQVHLIDFEFASRGDPMFDLAFFAVSIHLPMAKALALLQPYHTAVLQLGAEPDTTDQDRLALYAAYQRLFRHVASHNEGNPAGTRNDQFDRWLYQLHEDVNYLEENSICFN